MEETMTTFEQLPEMMAILLKKVESLKQVLARLKIISSTMIDFWMQKRQVSCSKNLCQPFTE